MKIGKEAGATRTLAIRAAISEARQLRAWHLNAVGTGRLRSRKRQSTNSSNRTHYQAVVRICAQSYLGNAVPIIPTWGGIVWGPVTHDAKCPQAIKAAHTAQKTIESKEAKQCMTARQELTEAGTDKAVMFTRSIRSIPEERNGRNQIKT